MKHISKIDGKTYEISRSMSVENGKEYDDDINLIWTTAGDGYTRLVDFYYGNYYFDETEKYIEDYVKGKNDMKAAVKQSTDKILMDYMLNNDIESGDITPAQQAKMDELIGQLGDLMQEVADQNKPKKKTLSLPICYVDFIDACLATIKEHHLIELVNGDNEYGELDEVRECFCKPLWEADKDAVVVIE